MERLNREGEGAFEAGRRKIEEEKSRTTSRSTETAYNTSAISELEMPHPERQTLLPWTTDRAGKANGEHLAVPNRAVSVGRLNWLNI